MNNETNRIPQISVGVLVKHFGGVLLVKLESDQQWQLPRVALRWGESLPEAVERIVQTQAGVKVEAGDIVQTYDLITEDDLDISSHVVVLDFEAFYRDGDLRAGDSVLDVAWASGFALKTMTVEENTTELLADLGFM